MNIPVPTKEVRRNALTERMEVQLPSDNVHAVLSRESALKFYAGLDNVGDLADETTIARWVERVLVGLIEPVRTSTF